MRPIRDTIPLDQAQKIIDDAIRPIQRIERVGLFDAHGRVLARDVVSDIDVPPFARASMDGYAVRAEDTFGASHAEPKILRRVEQLFTGEVSSHTLTAGECIEIATGAPMPAGADAVVIVEETDSDGDRIRILTAVHPRQNVGRRLARHDAGRRPVRHHPCSGGPGSS